MLKLKMNDTNVVNINSGVIPTTVDVKGVPTKALKIEISAEEMDVKQIKEVFGSEIATSEMTLMAADGSTASVHSNFTKLRSIAYDVDNNVYSIIIAKETDIPTMIANLESSVNDLMRRVEESDASVKVQYQSVVDDTTKAVASLKKDLGVIDTNVQVLSSTVNNLTEKVNTPSQGSENTGNSVDETPVKSDAATDNVETGTVDTSASSTTNETDGSDAANDGTNEVEN